MSVASCQLLDSHCHLTDPRLAGQVDQVIARAKESGVIHLLTIGTDDQDNRDCVVLCQRFPTLRCSLGIHPNYCHESTEEHLQALRKMVNGLAVVGVGEMGLDYHHEFAPRPRQRELFLAQLQLATDCGKPAIIHCRQAVDDTLAVMKDFPQVRAVFHCFTGSVQEARRILDAGYLLGFTGVVTFKKNDEIRDVVRLTPLDRLLVETDAPYLSPEPMRSQKTNEPALIVHTYGQIAEIKQVTVEKLGEVVRQNSARLFGWPLK